MKVFQNIYNYFFYCGIGKEEFYAVRKDVFTSNFVVWRILHFFMALLFLFLFVSSFFTHVLKSNSIFYLATAIYAAITIILFHFYNKTSIIAQINIYLSITVLFLFGCFITMNNPTVPATSYIALILIAPMFLIGRPIWMTIEICLSSICLLFVMYKIKPHNIWLIDLANVIPFSIASIFLNIIANSIRIKEFVLRRKINIQKDIDELTGLKNKSALTKAINKYLKNDESDKGLMFMMDIDRFKSINDTYGHDIGDDVISQVGQFLAATFSNKEIIGRFGGDEFIVFIKNTDDIAYANQTADTVVKGISSTVKLPDPNEKVCVSIGIAVYKGEEKNYSEIFKKADLALYKSKADKDKRFYIS